LLRFLFMTIALLSIGGPAPAEETGAAPVVTPPAATIDKAEPSVAEKRDTPATDEVEVEAGKAAAGKAEARKKASEHELASSQAAYIRLLAAEFRRHVPKRGADVHAGWIEVVFEVGASGRVVSHRVTKAQNRKELEPVVRRILAAVQAPPPPGGSFKGSQTFNFGAKLSPRGKYLQIIYELLERRKAVPHAATVIFHIAATGRVDAVKILRARNREQAKLIRERILGMSFPPPPAGACDIKGVFR
jgi:hypothetical protein